MLLSFGTLLEAVVKKLLSITNLKTVIQSTKFIDLCHFHRPVKDGAAL